MDEIKKYKKGDPGPVADVNGTNIEPPDNCGGESEDAVNGQTIYNYCYALTTEGSNLENAVWSASFGSEGSPNSTAKIFYWVLVSNEQGYVVANAVTLSATFGSSDGVLLQKTVMFYIN